jgi:hypothetical protein
MKTILTICTAAAAISTSACSAQNYAAPAYGGITPISNIVHRANSKLPTLYILNAYANKTKGWVSAYSDAGATFARKFGTIGGNGPESTSMAADAKGHLYLYSGTTLGQVLAYENYGAKVLQTLQYQKNTVFSSLTLDHSGNLFAMVKRVKKFAGPLDEFRSDSSGSLKPKPLIRHDAVPFYIATDAMGDVASAGGINGLKVYAKKSRNPFWTLNTPNTEYLEVAFDASNNLYVAQSTSSADTPISVYARGASTPKYSITNLSYYPEQLAFDGFGNLYVLGSCISSCGPTTVISIYAPDATNPSTVLQPTPGTQFETIGVSTGGYVGATEYASASIRSVVVYAPGATVPSTTISTGLQFPLQVVFGN